MRNMIIILLFVILSFHAIAQGTVLQGGNAEAVKVSPERLKRIDQLIQGQIDSGLIKGAVGSADIVTVLLSNKSVLKCSIQLFCVRLFH